MEKVSAKLKDGTPVYGDKFDHDDFIKIMNTFVLWTEINDLTKSLNARGINIPEIISEGLYCYSFNAIRTNGAASGAGSYDAVSLDTGRGIQIKSSSIEFDCTSFGPDSKWDDLIFMDFCPNGKVDGTVNFYLIKQDFRNMVLDAKKNETFEDQQKQGRRPRFSIKKNIIIPYKLKPIKTIKLLKN